MCVYISCTYHDMTADTNEQNDFSVIVYDAKCIALVLCNHLHEYYISAVGPSYFGFSYFITLLLGATIDSAPAKLEVTFSFWI